MIKLLVIGNLGRDAELKTLQSGKNVINFSCAHTEKYKDAQGNQQQKTTWVECSYFTDKTGITPYLKKGTQVYVEGQPEVRTYQTADGRQGSSLSVRVNSVQLLGGGEKQEPNQYAQTVQNYQQAPAAAVAQQGTEAATDDGLPF